MKSLKTFLALLGLAAWTTASGAIPQLINYQGLLLDQNGTKVTGVKAITLKVFTGATDGNGTKEIYDENVGNVSVTDGLYAFNFGGGGQSVITTTETVGTGDGSTQIFNYTVEHPPVLDGSVTIVKANSNNGNVDDSWTQTGGSSSPNFIASVVNTTGAVAVTNAAGAPGSNRIIEITYDYNSVGIMGALATNSNAWLEVSVDGSPLLPRQRLVAVPFANVASTIQGENLSVDPISGNVIVKNDIVKPDGSPHAISSFGAWENKSHDTVYLAETDGIVVMYQKEANTWLYYYEGSTSGNVAETFRHHSDTGYLTMTVPVSKGRYWKAKTNGNSSLFILKWKSIGN